MQKESTRNKTLAVLASALLLGGGLVALVGTAAAHACEATDDEGCNAHSCPEGENHHHVAKHWWRTHYCISGSYCDSAVTLAPPTTTVAFEPVSPDVPLPFGEPESTESYYAPSIVCSGLGGTGGEIPV